MGLWDFFRRPARTALPAPKTTAPEITHATLSRDRHVTTSTARRDSLFNPLTNMGSGGDKSEVARPNLWVTPLNDEELRALYNYNGIARRIVDILPEYSVRRGWAAKGASSAEEKQLQIRTNVEQAMVLAQLYGGSAMLLVTIDDVPGSFQANPQDYLKQPLDLKRVERLAAVQVFDTFEASPMSASTDITDPNYRQPEFWSIGAHGFSAVVHASRIVQFKGRARIPSERWGGGFGGSLNRQQDVSYLQVVYDQIRHLAETMRSGAILATEAQKSVWKIAGLDSIRAGDEANDLISKLAAAQRAESVLGGKAIGKDDDFFHVAGTSTGFRELSDGQMAMLSLVTGIPQMVFFGQQPSGFSADGDASWKGFRQTVNAYQEAHGRGPLERLYQVMASARDRDNTIDPDDVQLTFRPLDEPTDLERAQTRLVNVQADAIEVQSGVLSPDEVRQRYQSDDGYQVELPVLEDVDPEEAAERMLLLPPQLADLSSPPGNEPVPE